MKLFKGTLVGVLVGGIVGAGVTAKILTNSLGKIQQKSDKHLEMFKLMNQWVKIKQEGKELKAYFERNQYKTIAIYGMSYIGEKLVDELKDSDIEIAYAVDQRADTLYSEIEIVTPDDELEEVDAIIVTAISFFEEIEDKLSQKIDCPIISLEDILYEI